MVKYMLNFLKNWLARKELAKLEYIESEIRTYRGWLSEFPMISLTLMNLLKVIEGKESLDACHPPGPVGPWTIDNLRYRLRKDAEHAERRAEDENEDWRKEFDRKHEQLVKTTAEVKQLQLKLEEASRLLVEKNREVNQLQLLCTEVHQQTNGTVNFLDQKVAEQLGLVAKGEKLV